MAAKLETRDLMSLEEYARRRVEFRRRVLAHKKHRKLMIGSHAMLHFEDRLTIQYQVQEMLRVERIFEERGIRDELEAYNPLIPDGANLKATLMIEFPDADERKAALARLVGIEDLVWVQVDGHERVRAVADEDMERATAEKTSSVHFLRFDLDIDMIASLKHGAALAAGIDHDAYRHATGALPDAVRESLVGDLD
ncbi:MAG: DUF3501 family protein [Gammaproteobacteria bacterium]|nr:DUF3501 family protein [Gammaproteobacteria bacterium]